ncbi:MAG: MerR family transcriptional regulator [Lachnospiraceae bacterium]
MALDLKSLQYGRPADCSKCGGNLRYVGIGEYECESCRNIELDDYGKVRTYIEENRGATQSEVSTATGVDVNKIRQMLREEKIEIAPNSVVFLQCESCGAKIRSGKYCDACAGKAKKEDDARRLPPTQGFVKGTGAGAKGERRFMR